jgi:hypothetical protein
MRIFLIKALLWCITMLLLLATLRALEVAGAVSLTWGPVLALLAGMLIPKAVLKAYERAL